MQTVLRSSLKSQCHCNEIDWKKIDTTFEHVSMAELCDFSIYRSNKSYDVMQMTVWLIQFMQCSAQISLSKTLGTITLV